MYLFILLFYFIYRSIYLSIYQSIYQLIYLFIYFFIRPIYLTSWIASSSSIWIMYNLLIDDFYIYVNF